MFPGDFALFKFEVSEQTITVFHKKETPAFGGGPICKQPDHDRSKGLYSICLIFQILFAGIFLTLSL